MNSLNSSQCGWGMNLRREEGKGRRNSIAELLWDSIKDGWGWGWWCCFLVSWLLGVGDCGVHPRGRASCPHDSPCSLFPGWPNIYIMPCFALACTFLSSQQYIHKKHNPNTSSQLWLLSLHQVFFFFLNKKSTSNSYMSSMSIFSFSPSPDSILTLLHIYIYIYKIKDIHTLVCY